MKLSQILLILLSLHIFIECRRYNNYKSKPYYAYRMNLKGGNKYVGYTQNPNKRFNDHYHCNGH